MKIIPLEKSNLELFVSYCYVARSDLHPHLLQGTLRKHDLYTSKIDSGLNGLLAQDSSGLIGIIEWMPLAISHLGFDIPDAIYLHCIWVKTTQEGMGIGSALMEEMLSQVGNCPIVTFGYTDPRHMPGDFFGRSGFVEIEKYHDMRLLLRQSDVLTPEKAASLGPLIRPEMKHERLRGRKPLFVFHNDFCPFNWLSLHRVLKDIKGRDDIYFRLFNTNFRKYPEACGEGPTIYLDSHLKNWHPCNPGFVKGLLKASEGR